MRISDWSSDVCSSDLHTGGTTITAGTLQLGNGGTTGGISGDVANNATLAFNRSNGLTFDGLISGIGSVNKLGAGTVIFSADNSYTGITTIAAGDRKSTRLNSSH